MTEPVIVVHGGAGGFGPELTERAGEYREALVAALGAGAHALESGGGAVEAVSAAVMAMEEFPLFNAGYGSALCDDGSVELSASAMRGSDRAAGAAATGCQVHRITATAPAARSDPRIVEALSSTDPSSHRAEP